MGVRFSKIKRSKSKRKKNANNLEGDGTRSCNNHNCFSVTNWEQKHENVAAADDDDDDDTNVVCNNYDDLDEDLYITVDNGDETYSPRPEEDTDDDKVDGVYDKLPADKLSLQSGLSSKKRLEISAQRTSGDSAFLSDRSSCSLFNKTSDYSDFGALKQTRAKRLTAHEQPCDLKTTIIPDQLIPQMVEAFRPLIEDCIRVNEVLPYLHFLADRDVIEAKERESPRRAASLLLDQINASDELGKWTTFLNALKTVGYTYIANIVLGVTEIDLTLQRHLLKVFIPELINNLQPSELIDHLYSSDVISVTDKEEIECELRNRGSYAASLMLLDRIPRRIPNWYSEFVNALRNCGFGYLADKIDVSEAEITDTSCSTVSPSSMASYDTQETYEIYDDDWYIHPNSSPRDAVPPPVPERPQMIGRSMKKSDMSYNTPLSLPLGKDIRQVSQVELTNEKRRLAGELEDIKHKRTILRDIKGLQKQIEMTINMDSDEENAHTDGKCQRESSGNSLGPKVGEDKDDDKVTKSDKASQTNTDDFTSPAAQHVTKLSDVTLAQISLDVTNAVKQVLENTGMTNGALTDQRARHPALINDLSNTGPRAHKMKNDPASDSGMYSNFSTSLYLSSPIHYD